MLFGFPCRSNSAKIHETLGLNGCDIERVTNAKSLGASLDERLNWERQLKTTYDKSRSILDRKKSKKYFPTALLR